jgi:pyridoxal phosphate enzyme (YggS family)
VELFSVVESVDSLELATRLDRLVAERGVRGAPADRTARLPIYLQVNVDADPAKAGFTPAEIADQIARLAELPRLELAGLMTVGRLVAEPDLARPTFAGLRELSVHLRARQPVLGPGLSMGMTDDFEVAVEEGSTLVRVGRALFGERHPA